MQVVIAAVTNATADPVWHSANWFHGADALNCTTHSPRGRVWCSSACPCTDALRSQHRLLPRWAHAPSLLRAERGGHLPGSKGTRPSCRTSASVRWTTACTPWAGPTARSCTGPGCAAVRKEGGGPAHIGVSLNFARTIHEKKLRICDWRLSLVQAFARMALIRESPPLPS